MDFANNIKENLRAYIIKNEVVFQAFGDLVEVANEVEKENRYQEIKDEVNSLV
ncbi:MAG: hypothetical protein Q4A08_00400 [Bacteroidales bacterium]|nr:hypothetical protein [Bacteroidales bacterium]